MATQNNYLIRTVGINRLLSLSYRLASFAALAACCVFLSGCMVEFTNPLPGSRHFTADKHLIGRWSGKDEQGNKGFIEFNEAPRSEIAVSILGEHSDLGYRNPIFTLKTAKIGAFDYLVLRPNDSDSSPNYTLARYAIHENKLKIWILSVDKLGAALKNGQLKGTVGGGPYGGVVVTSKSPDILRLINRPESDAFFTYLGEYEKVTK